MGYNFCSFNCLATFVKTQDTNMRKRFEDGDRFFTECRQVNKNQEAVIHKCVVLLMFKGVVCSSLTQVNGWKQ